MTWSDRSSNTAKEIEKQLTDFIEEKGIACVVIHTMTGFNDRIIVRPTKIDRGNQDTSYGAVSLILSWMFADADMAAVTYSNKDDIIVKYETSDHLTYKNEESAVNPERWKISEHIRNNDVKYFQATFDDREVLSQIISDMKICIEKMWSTPKG